MLTYLNVMSSIKRVLILSVVFFIAACATQTPREHGKRPPGTYLEKNMGDKTIYSYPPPNAIDGKQSKGMFTPKSNFEEVRIALLVPLTGSYEKIGDALFEAAQLALFSIDERNMVLMPFDTKGTTYGAKEAAERAVSEKVDLIIGPLFGKSALSVYEVASAQNIEVISFSNDKNLANSGVFTLGLRPEEQVRRILNFAMYQDIREYSTVLPNNVYGASIAKEFRESLEQDNMFTALKTEIYRINQQGNATALSKHVGRAYNAAKNMKPPKDYDEELEKYNDEPLHYPRGMLIPEGGKRLQEILYVLTQRKFNSDVVKLLGTNEWHDADTFKEPLMEKAWFAGYDHDRSIQFASQFESVYGYAPPTVTTLAYDAMALAATLARFSNGQDFSANAITNPRGYIGVDGIFRFLPNGLTQRGLAVYEIQNGQPVVIEPAPENFHEVVQHQRYDGSTGSLTDDLIEDDGTRSNEQQLFYD